LLLSQFIIFLKFCMIYPSKLPPTSKEITRQHPVSLNRMYRHASTWAPVQVPGHTQRSLNLPPGKTFLALHKKLKDTCHSSKRTHFLPVKNNPLPHFRSLHASYCLIYLNGPSSFEFWSDYPLGIKEFVRVVKLFFLWSWNNEFRINTWLLFVK